MDLTLLLTALTPDCIVQVSDRRAVDGPDIQDGVTKAVLTPNLACSYTGVADLGQDTAEWLALGLAEHASDPDAGLQALAGSLSYAFREPKFSGRGLTVVTAGGGA